MAKKGRGNYRSQTIENDDGASDLSAEGEFSVAVATFGHLEREIKSPHVSSSEEVSNQVKFGAEPLDIYYVRLYQNGTLLGDLTIFPDERVNGTGHAWGFVPQEFTNWMKTLKQDGGVYSAQHVPQKALAKPSAPTLGGSNLAN